MNIFQLGVPRTVIVDDYLATTDQSHDDSKLRFGLAGTDKSLWLPLLEKAYAKAIGNYEHLVGGVMARGVRSIIGGAFELHDHKTTTADALWKELSAHDGSDDIINAGTTPHTAGHSA